MNLLSSIEHLIQELLLIFGTIGLLVAVIVLFQDLKSRLSKKELIGLSIITIGSLAARLLFGLFGPIHPEDHHFHIILNIARNFQDGLFTISSRYYASGGLYEMIHQIFLTPFSEFNVYYLYYINIGLHITAGLLVFLLALNLFKSKNIAFLSYLVVSFLPVLIVFSATNIKFIADSLALLAFLNLLFLFLKKEKSWFLTILLMSTFSANLVGRKDYALFFIVSSFALVGLKMILSKKFTDQLIKNKHLQSLASFSIFASLFFIFSDVIFHAEAWRRIAEAAGGTSLADEWEFLKGFFRFWDASAVSFATYMNSFFTPWYFIIAFLATPAVLFLKKKYILLAGFLISFVFIMFLGDWALSNNIRKQLPLIFLLIPIATFSLVYLLKKIKIPTKVIMLGLSGVILLSPIQNRSFLTLETDRKIEQDFLIDLLADIPSESLILTIHEKKYEGYGYPYRHLIHGNEFYSYLLPQSKNIDVMDIYHEYNPDIIREYDNVFYYKSLYSHHEKDIFIRRRNLNNPDHKNGFEVSEEFENKHTLIPIKEKKVENFGFHIRSVYSLVNRTHFTIYTNSDNLKIGLYKIDEFKK